ncbi:MAG TPA: precorrin-6y C5,15-methyltransferase (decarboxylating) subunit CbiE [Stenomitos sp.]
MSGYLPPWLSIVGIGEDGLAGLSSGARTLVETAEVLVGGDRHLNFIPADHRERLSWRRPISDSIQEILARKPKRVCVLASGNPMWYGIGTTLLQQIPRAELTIIPAPSTFSLACAQLGWSMVEVETLSLCSRPLGLLNAVIYPGAKLLILSENRNTPEAVATQLRQLGYGSSPITVLEHLGGPQERRIENNAADWSTTDLADLNIIAVECIAIPGTRPLSRFPGLPDDAYRHDGQLTKREVRAITLSSLAPCPGELLWDVGAGCGSIAIEWMRNHPRCRAIAIEPKRGSYIAENAAALGVPNLQIVNGKAPEALADLPQPNAIFIGGGATTPGLLETCWKALPIGGRLVANVVTLEGEQVLYRWQQTKGGTLTRIEIQRTGAIGSFTGWKPMAPVTQWVSFKAEANTKP